jgi:hypothetical protein
MIGIIMLVLYITLYYNVDHYNIMIGMVYDNFTVML